MPRLKVEFDLTADQAKQLEEVLKRENVKPDEACRLLLVNHLEASQTEATFGIKRRLPRGPNRPAPFLHQPR